MQNAFSYLIDSPSGSILELAKELDLDLASDFEGLDLTGFDLSGQDLSGMSFALANLSQVNLSGASLNGVNLNGTMLQGATIEKAFGKNVVAVASDFRQARIRDLSLKDSVLESILIADAEISFLDLTGSRVSHVDFSSAHVGDICVHKAEIDKDVSFGGARLHERTNTYVHAKQAQKKVAVNQPLVSSRQTKTQIINAISESTNLSKKDVAAVFASLGKMIEQQLLIKGAGEFAIPDTGVKIRRVKKAARKARMGRNPATGEAFRIAAKKRAEVTIQAEISKKMLEKLAK